MTQEDTGPAAPIHSASRIRDQLANERTFLAWVRTALGLIGLGFVLARMGLFLQQLAMAGGNAPVPRPHLHAGHEFMVTGVVFALLGTALCGWTGWLYHRTRRTIDENRYEPAANTVTFLTAVVVVGGALIVGLVLWRTVTQE